MTDPVKPSANTTPVTIATSTEAAKPVTFTAEQFAAIQQIVVAATVAVQSQQKNAAPNLSKQYAPQCPECYQPTSACKGKHVKMIIYPTRYPEFWKYFKGVKINGVEYVSNRPGQLVTVPACCESTITNAIVQFEDNERTMLVGRKANHNSGSIGPKGKGINPAISAWR